MSETKTLFDMSLFTRALSPMPYAVVNNVLILLTAIETAELADDGSLMLCFTSGNELTLPPAEAMALQKILQEALSRAIQLQAQQSAAALGIISPPPLRRGNS